MNHLVVILGPTGVGKTDLSIRLAEHYHSPIINADSRQVFAELPIGTAAPTFAQQKRVPHYFVGHLRLQDTYNASMFEQDAIALLDDLFNGRGDDRCPHPTVVMTGGSMLYIDAVCKGIDDIPTIDEVTRQGVIRTFQEEGLPALVEELKERDPEHWKIVDKNNPRRVMHAVEICRMTGKTFTSYRTNTTKQRPFQIIKIGLNRPREELYERINQRVLKMVEDGLIEEARRVYPLKGLNALNTVGYKELFRWFEGDIPCEEAIRQIQSNTRQYMRKQLTWFKKDKSIEWFSPDNIEDILNYLDKKIQ